MKKKLTFFTISDQPFEMHLLKSGFSQMLSFPLRHLREAVPTKKSQAFIPKTSDKNNIVSMVKLNIL